ncbi:muscleblind-like protein 1 [Caerostris extrusa]|uniref:Muscleblind-like protein 1 n=1 Tax=Caerostris extrusa TaxID=172846 RepID=A0AAV4XG74_CAEEX|nr:muscleblind-like protein 1 [Caerostris extrusa]
MPSSHQVSVSLAFQYFRCTFHGVSSHKTPPLVKTMGESINTNYKLYLSLALEESPNHNQGRSVSQKCRHCSPCPHLTKSNFLSVQKRRHRFIERARVISLAFRRIREPLKRLLRPSSWRWRSDLCPSVRHDMAMVSSLTAIKDSRWLQLEVCREFQRNKCSRSDTDCKFAHPPSHVEVQNGRVIACYDSIKVNLLTIFFRPDSILGLQIDCA